MPTKTDKADKYPLKPKQRKMAQLLANPDCNNSITQLCDEVGVARSTFYDWLTCPAFMDYLDQLIDKYTSGELAAVWRALLGQCKKGDIQAIKLYFELKGKYKQSTEVTGKDGKDLDLQSTVQIYLPSNGREL